MFARLNFDRRVEPEFIPSCEGAGHHRRRRCARRPGQVSERGKSLAAVHKPDITAVESPGEVETAAPPIPAKPKTAKSSTPSRPNVAAAKASSKSKHVGSGGSRGRAVAARSSAKSSVRTASRSSVKRAAMGSVRTASKSSVTSASKSSVKTATKTRSTHGHVVAASKRHARIAAASAANPHDQNWRTGDALGGGPLDLNLLLFR